MTVELPKIKNIENQSGAEAVGMSRDSAAPFYDKEGKAETAQFSKRYAAFYRKQIAERIRNLRAQYRTKLEEKPREIESIKSSIPTYQLSIKELIEQKISDEKHKTNLEAQRSEIALEVETIRADLNKRKNTFWYKVQGIFSEDKLKDEENEVAQGIKDKTDKLADVDLSIRVQDQRIKRSHDSVAQLEEYVAKKYGAIKEVEEVINSDQELKDIERTVANFYAEMSAQKGKFEIEREQRSVANISTERDVLFCHSIPLEAVTDNGFSQNNELVTTNRFGPKEKIKMILGVEPTVAVSTINKENQTLVGNFGLILKSGQVLSAYAGDAGTLIDEGIYNRKSKYDPALKNSIIQPDIEINLDHAVTHTQKRNPRTNSSVEDMHQGWNELVVENPEAAGLFFQKDNPKNGESDFKKALKISQDLGLPLYILDAGKICQMDGETGNLVEISREDVFNSAKNISPDEKKGLIGEIIDKESFNVKKENIYKFNGLSAGKAYYQLIKRVDAGEKVSIYRTSKGEVLGEGEVPVELMAETFVMGTTRLSDEDWEKFEKYVRTSDSGTEFRVQFPGALLFSPASDFVPSDDNLTSFVNMTEAGLQRLSNFLKDARNENKSLGDMSLMQKSLVYVLFGFAEESKKNNDFKNYEKAIKIVERFTNIRDCEEFLSKRLGENGKFKYLEEDAPFEVRAKLKD
ncbi:MAG: hypothetical protein WCI76_02870 [bacterium]